ncbi:hypothetical protein [Streptomyces fungicidicus]|uniref:hypothetical protein n=1 Tax=Streptomyces fungicidicus TaxID=68203 RepID=UPI0037FF6B37
MKAKAAQAAGQVQDKIPGPVKDKAPSAAGQDRAKAAQATQMLQYKAPRGWPTAAGMG